MTVNFSPFRSLSGFSSPGFLVSPTGNLSVSGDVIISGDLQADTIVYNGVALLETEDSTVSLSSAITNSSLTSLGKLVNLEISGDVTVTDINDNINISIVNGIISIASTEVGSIENIVIGSSQPQDAYFKNVTVGEEGNNNELEIIGNLTVSDLATINSIETTSIETNNMTINNSPTELYHATRKDYVDNRISALSIALGS